MADAATGGEPTNNPFLAVLSASDATHEAALLADPYSLRTWLRYLDHRLAYAGSSLDSHQAAVYERAVAALPGSYKLWKRYMAWCAVRLRRLSGWAHHAEAVRIANAYRRALAILHKMPRLWTDYLTHLTKHCAHCIADIRAAFDASLRALPPTQHSRIWELYLPWADSVGGALAAHVHRRALKLDPDRLHPYIGLLLKLGRISDAAGHLMKAIEATTDMAESYSLFQKLTDLAVKHPTKMPGVSAEHILRAGIRRFPNQSAKFWTALARHWVAHSRLEKARDVFVEALAKVTTMRDFTFVFDAYVELEERVVSVHMARVAELEQQQQEEGEDSALREALEEAQLDIDIRLERLERLMNQRPILVNDVLLRQNPHNVNEWLRRAAELLPGSQTFEEAIQAIHSKQATGKLDELWAAYAQYFENQEDLESARDIFERAVQVEFKSPAELVRVWIEYADMELRHSNVDRALDLMGRATAIPANTNVNYNDPKLTPQRRLFKALALWSYYADLEESFGSLEAVCAVYDAMIDLKIATPQVIVNYALYLESHDYFEQAYKVYERGIALFKYPAAIDLWNIYLAKFLERYGHAADDDAMALERARDLFEEALAECPEKHARALYIVYASHEEQHGQARRAMRVLERGVRSVPPVQRRQLAALYVSRATSHFGAPAARGVYERILPLLPDADAASACLEFAALEVRLGDIPRARAVFAHGAAWCDPRVRPEYWQRWHDFEVRFGNEDTFKEMLRIKRGVQAAASADAQYLAATLHAAKKKQQLLREELAAKADEDNADAAAAAKLDIAFVPAAANGATATSKVVDDVEQKQVPDAVFGKAKALLDKQNSQKNPEGGAGGEDTTQLGAKARLAKKRKV